ncbi:MAG: hypothetical protein ACOX6V_03280 [Patescibacteria group bacterium]|jgi:hypothetical protein
MATLTEVTHYSRKAIKFTGLGIAGYITLQILITNGIKLYKYLNPPPPPPPTVGFGTLPKIKFPDNPGYNYQFQLQTPTGNFPSFPDRAAVFYMPFKRPSLLALDEATKLAIKLRFFSEPKDLSSGIYEWTKNIPSPLTLKINSLNGSFSLNYQWQTDSNLLLNKSLQGRERTIDMAKSFLSSIGRTYADIDFANGKITYLKASDNKMVPVKSLLEADFIKADFFRNDIENYNVITSNPENGIISMIFSGSTNPEKQVVYVKSNYFPADYLSPETYPLKPVALAWEDLKSGKAFIAKDESDSDTVTIRRIYLAYYDSEIPQQFLQPIYMFTNDDENPSFIAYVPAISGEYIQINSGE